MVDKIKQIEQEVLEQPQENLVKAMDPLKLGIEEMKRTFSSIFTSNQNKNKYLITPEMEKFEKDWLKHLN